MQIVWQDNQVLAVYDDAQDLTDKYPDAVILTTAISPNFVAEDVASGTFFPGQLAQDQDPQFIADSGLTWSGSQWVMPAPVEARHKARKQRSSRAADRIRDVLTINAIRELKTLQDSYDLVDSLVSEPTQMSELPAFVDEVRVMFGRVLHVIVNNGRLSLQNEDAIQPDDE